MSRDIYLDAPNVGRLEKKYLNDAIDRCFVSTIGPFVPEFENRFARFLGMPKAVSTQSGTAAIHISLYELGIAKGDEVLVPALTFVATVNPVLYLGAKPVFVDVDICTWTMSPEDIEKNITKKTRAIIPVHLYGNPCDMDPIMKLAKKHRLYVVEDAAESLGAVYAGAFTGTLGDLGCYSFNGNKVMTTGGGGMIVGKDNKRLEHIRFLVNQARRGSNFYDHPEIGFNYRMTNIEASLGLAQMHRLKEFLHKKKRANQIYRRELGRMDYIRFQEEYNMSASSNWLTCILFDKRFNIKKIQEMLRRKGIPTRRIFPPIIEFGPYKKYKKDSYQNSYKIYNNGLCLPSSTLNSEDDIYYVCNVLKNITRGGGL